MHRVADDPRGALWAAALVERGREDICLLVLEEGGDEEGALHTRRRDGLGRKGIRAWILDCGFYLGEQHGVTGVAIIVRVLVHEEPSRRPFRRLARSAR